MTVQSPDKDGNDSHASHALCVSQFHHPLHLKCRVNIIVCVLGFRFPNRIKCTRSDTDNYVMSRSHPRALERCYAAAKWQIMVWSTQRKGGKPGDIPQWSLLAAEDDNLAIYGTSNFYSHHTTYGREGKGRE